LRGEYLSTGFDAFRPDEWRDVLRPNEKANEMRENCNFSGGCCGFITLVDSLRKLERKFMNLGGGSVESRSEFHQQFK